MPVANKLMKGMRKTRSKVWNHFDKIDHINSKCIHCSRCISVSGGSIGNLLRHIKRKHPSIEIIGGERDAKRLDIKQLINMVSQRKPLWDFKDPDFAFNETCEKLWNEISLEMDISRELACIKWNDLRTKFKLEYQKSLTNNGKIIRSHWPYYCMLTFLENVISTEILSENSILVEDTITEVVTTEEHIDDSTESLEFVNINTTSFKAEPSCNLDDTARNHGWSDAPAVVREFLSPKVKHQFNGSCSSCNNYPEWSVDEDISFLNTLLPHMRKLTATEKFRMRNEINSVMLRYLCDDHNYNNSNGNTSLDER